MQTTIYTQSDDRDEVIFRQHPEPGYTPLVITGVASYDEFKAKLDQVQALRIRCDKAGEPEHAEFETRPVSDFYDELGEYEYALPTDCFMEAE